MKNLLHNILIFTLLLSLNCGTAIAAAMPEPAPVTAQEKKKAEAEKKKKEADKKKAAAAKAKAKALEQKKKEQAKVAAQKQKEAEKKKAEAADKREEAAKAAEKQQAERAKAQVERQKEAEKKQAAIEQAQAKQAAQEEAQKQAWLKQQAELAHPKPEVVNYINISARAGYAAMMDKPAMNWSDVPAAGTPQIQSVAGQTLKGGPGAGLTVGYELEYQHFRFETGLDFTWLNSTSDYAFSLIRTDKTYDATYSYITDGIAETRNVGYIGLPIMLGAEFSRYYFMVGAKVGYGLFGTYKQKGQYDIIVDDPALYEPYGAGVVSVPAEAADNHKLKMKQPSVSICAEVGLDLDEWLQQQPDPKAKKGKIKPGQRLPFGREHIHYKVGLFAEYGVLNTNAMSGTYPLTFASNAVNPVSTNSMLALGDGAKLNNLFVGVKFTVQFEIPGKKARPLPAPASYAQFTVVDDSNNQKLNQAMVSIFDTKKNRTTMQPKSMGKGFIKQRTGLGNYEATAEAADYYTEKVAFSVDSPGIVVPVEIRMRHVPVFKVTVLNKETGVVLPATVQVRKRGTQEARYTLTTDSTTGSSRAQLADSVTYAVHIEQMGYEPYDAGIANLGDSMIVQLMPIKKGEVFIMKDMFFATNKTRILKKSEESMNNLFMFLERNPEISINIIGHTDNVGKDDANQKLSEGRANAVRNELIERGIAADRIEAEGRGESQPIDTNDTEEGRQNNRRVEIEIL